MKKKLQNPNVGPKKTLSISTAIAALIVTSFNIFFPTTISRENCHKQSDTTQESFHCEIWFYSLSGWEFAENI